MGSWVTGQEEQGGQDKAASKGPQDRSPPGAAGGREDVEPPSLVCPGLTFGEGTTESINQFDF